MKFGDFQLTTIKESSFKLDGGALFGVVPKTMWNNLVDLDDLNRVLLACNLLLIDTPNGRVLIETGMGPRWSAKEKERFGIKLLIDHEHVFDSFGVKNEDIDAVVMSHLHFDHAGGAVVQRDGKLVPAFPNAKYYSQKGEFEFAQRANARARASYRSDDYMPLMEAGCLQLLDGDKEILPGVSVHVTGGHTCHHQIVTFTSRGHTGIFFADILPTVNHLPPAWVMGYDHFPLTSCDQKSEWLLKASKDNWLVVFDHEIGTPWGHVRANNGKFVWEPLAENAGVAI